MNRYQWTLYAIFLICLAVSWINPLYPGEMFLQHAPTVLFLVLLPIVTPRVPLSNGAYTCLILFWLLHVLGARYTYSNVPYDNWTESLFGLNLTERFDLSRNHYDRLVHFSFGALWVLPVWEVCVKTFKVPRRFAIYTAFEFVLAYSMLYELVEWLISLLLSPDAVESYNGQQGDMWDAHKDTLCAMLGALFATLVLTVVEIRRGRSQPPGSR
ncbi:MAG: DUF2238 domain-containing protein [Planctomycetota bacterium]|nr:DUF2238 domain-containing protein [Planctomycetota bacterium]